MKKIFCLFCVCIFISVGAFAQEVLRVSEEFDNGFEQSDDSSSADLTMLDKAKILYQEGKLVELRDLYEDMLIKKGHLISESVRAELRQKYEKLNMQLLFSRIQTDDSLEYVVVSGDSLYKIAKKMNTTVELLQKSNGLSSSTIYPGDKLKVVKSRFSIYVDKSENVLRLKLAERVIKTYRVATGKNNSSPVGTFSIKDKLPNPTWYTSGAIVPPESEENILGTRWMGFDLKGYGIHGTTIPESIGTQSTAGCVRMLNNEVEQLYSIIPVGTKVVIVD